ncbi:low-density lipoprotein receptor-related protein 6 [Onthophagus taurus]|uniref:low-density lipoprotein receptor-related protein 6 n=1 Tax=Onthophagus taurus TaxID=166361 RepID=UPI000C20762C|nr:low-density lipoprotein receptor-related protein 6 [Onthophagus taurus]
MFRASMKKEYSRCYLFYVLVQVLFIIHISAENLLSAQNPILLYTTTSDVRVADTSSSLKQSKNKGKTNVLIPNVSDGMLDFNYGLKKLCWSNSHDETIQCGDFNGFEVKNREVVIPDAPITQGLACDWYTNKLYWTDSDKDHIEVTTMSKPFYRKVLYWTDIDQPRAIVVAPSKGLLFWTDWGEVPKIERASMDGNPNSRQIIVNERLYWPNCLTIDYEAELIYWADGNHRKIERMDFNGENRKVIKNSLTYPYGVTKFQNRLYWTDWKTSVIYVDDEMDVKEFLKLDPVPSDIHVWDSSVQVYNQNPCEFNNGGCSHLCLLSSSALGYSCGCPSGVKLITNTTCADGPKEILVLARRSNICLVYLDSPEYTYVTLNLTHMNFLIGVDYDPVEQFIYWTDDDLPKIQKVKLDGSEQQDVISYELFHPDGVAIDWVARNLYWAEAGFDRIEVATLDGKYRKIIIANGLYEPRAIAVSPELGWMFWSDWSEKNPKIERANLDGSDRTVIVTSNLTWPNGIALDVEKMRLYWCDAKTHKIEYTNMDGSNRIVLLDTDLKHPFGFTLLGEFLYWTDWHQRSIDRVHKDTGTSRERIVDQISDVMGLKAIQIDKITGTNPCGRNNGNCSHFCLYRHDKTAVCDCPIEYDLSKDGKTCYIPEAYFFFSTNGSIGRVDIERQLEVILPIKSVKYASSIDFDYDNYQIYWTDSKQKTVMRAFINGSDPQRVEELGLIAPNGIVVDWVSHNVYWSDSIAHKIEVARVPGTSRRVLLWENIQEPYSIALDPQRGYMYWSEWGNSKCLKRSAMDGSDPKIFIQNVNNAYGLIVDFKTKRLFWMETSTPALLSSDFNGLNRNAVVKDMIFKPQGLAMYNNFIYWSNTTSEELWKTSLSGEKSPVVKLSEPATDISIIFKPNQKITNNCGVNNGGCKHLCLAVPSTNKLETVSYTCACPTHYVKTNQTCLPPEKFIIYSQKNLVVRLLPDSQTDCLEAVLPIHGLKNVKSIDFDPVKQYLYWIEGKTLSIKKIDINANRDQSPKTVVASDPDIRPFDLAVDVFGHLLFWTCAAKDVINITRMNSTFVGVIEKKDEKPRLIAIHPSKRLLFYTDDRDNFTQIIRTRLDGTHRLIIGKSKAREIPAIAIDIENDFVVWVDGLDIWMGNIDGDNNYKVTSESKSKINALTVHTGWLYWLDRTINQLQRIELSTGNSRSTVLNYDSHILDLVSVTQPDTKHNCATLSCSHLCVIDGGSTAVCTCPPGLILKKDDNQTCIVLPGCMSGHFTCASPEPGTGNGCIPTSWRCDNTKDCSDGSDEMDCPVCKKDEYKCKNLQCISQRKVCDGVSDCKDGSDEEQCCKHNQYQCPQTDACISISSLCDGIEHCSNGEDESKSVCKDASQFIASPKSSSSVITVGVLTIVLIVLLLVGIFYFLRRKCDDIEAPLDQIEDLLTQRPHGSHKNPKLQKTIPDVVGMSMLNTSSHLSSYDRNNITGASSSTNASSIGCYPRETLNPPPSPATTGISTRASNPRYRPYRHYRAINQPPPPTPCSTDVCDESDYNYPVSRNRYDGAFPPPPTPRSHCQSESCPPSPSSRSSTYFSPLPPPPSPVTAPPKRYDS